MFMQLFPVKAAKTAVAVFPWPVQLHKTSIVQQKLLRTSKNLSSMTKWFSHSEDVFFETYQFRDKSQKCQHST